MSAIGGVGWRPGGSMFKAEVKHRRHLSNIVKERENTEKREIRGREAAERKEERRQGGAKAPLYLQGTCMMKPNCNEQCTFPFTYSERGISYNVNFINQTSRYLPIRNLTLSSQYAATSFRRYITVTFAFLHEVILCIAFEKRD